MNSSNIKMQTAIGLFVLSAIIITMLMVVYMTGGVRLDSGAYYVVANLDNIGDLKNGAPVKLCGVDIGKVKRITIEGKGVQVLVGINPRYHLQKDTTARIATSGLVGDAFLEFTRGKSTERLQCSTRAEDAVHVPGVTKAGMGDMMAQVQKIGGQVEEMVNNINLLIGKKEFRDNVEQSIANVNNVTAEVKTLLKDFHNNLDQIDQAVNNIVKITKNAETTMHTVDGFVTKMMGDPKLADDLVNTVKNINGITKTLADNKGSIETAMRNIGITTGNIADITGQIKPGQGLLRLLTDEQAGAEIMSVISSLQRAARCVATVGLSDLIADKLIGDKIAEKWYAVNGRGDAGEVARRWKEWMSQQKAYTDSISGQSAYGWGGYTMAPEANETVTTVVSPKETLTASDIDAIYGETAPAASVPEVKVEVTPSSPAPAGRHPLESFYRNR